ncbi:MAG: MotA/TolQ/ExbB proton channel family protein [Zoogloea sp.]|nr:MotA/TolQ/ExbB proton channel family protein [Zoogloea sp.]
MSFMIIHDAIMYLMVALTLLGISISIERFIFFDTVLKEGRRLGDYIVSHIRDRELRQELLKEFALAKGPQARVLCEVIRSEDIPRDKLEYMIQAQYVETQPLLRARLWMLETVVTAAPLLGLLGTIFGIIDAFHALSAGAASSDPAAVSRGIGTALFATGFGIAIAVTAFAFFNYFSSRAELVSTQIKQASLRFLSHC